MSVFTVGDTIFVGDWGKRRTTVWTAAGRLLDSLPAPGATRGYLPQARDAAGQYYFEVPPLPGRDGSGNRDSAAIVRAPSTLDRFDTVARLSPLELARVTRESMTRFEPRIFGGSDRWGVWPDGTVWIAFNGEIYNFNELNQQYLSSGHTFRTRSDTETIVHLYEELGEQVFSKLRGMFGIALWDGRRKRLLLARDRVGKKPLFYAWDGRRLVFGSEIKAMFPAGGIARDMDATTAYLRSSIPSRDEMWGQGQTPPFRGTLSHVSRPVTAGARGAIPSHPRTQPRR